MKIVVIQDILRSGGTERQTILLANAFAASGHPTTLLTFRPGGALESTVDHRVARRALQPFDLRLDWFAPRLSDAVQRSSPDVILCMGRMANCYAGDLQPDFPQVPVIATMRTGKKLPGRYVRSLASVRHIVANSRDASTRLTAEHSLQPGKISVIHNALVFPAASSLADQSTARAAVRIKHRASASTTILLCVAMFRPEKNQRGLIETVATLPSSLDWQLWLAGDGAARRNCEQVVAKLHLGSRVKFLGFHRDPSSLYAAADIAVHASESDALSNFVIEAQAHGLPAVVYQAQGMEECLIPAETGWVIPQGDHAAFHAAVLRLANEPAASRATRSATARGYARDTFDPQRQVAAYLELFHRLVSPASS